MERTVLCQLKDYVDNYNFITCCQSAFINNHSTIAVHKVISDIIDGLNENEITEMCIIDLRKVSTPLIIVFYLRNYTCMVLIVLHMHGLSTT